MNKLRKLDSRQDKSTMKDAQNQIHLRCVKQEDLRSTIVKKRYEICYGGKKIQSSLQQEDPRSAMIEKKHEILHNEKMI